MAKKHRSLLRDLIESEEMLLENPTMGAHLGRDCYKIRLVIRLKGRGKSGGARVITFFKSASGRIYLLSIFDKSEHEALE